MTIALDLLGAGGYDISAVTVVHTSGTAEPSFSSLKRLRQEMQLIKQQRPRLCYQEVEIRDGPRPLVDIDSEPGARATLFTLYREALRVKQRGDMLHLCVAGGRKTMAVYGMTVAQLLFEPDDHLWHLVSFGELLAEKRMHPQPGDQVSLVHIPLLRWSGVPPSVTEIGQLLDPEQAISAVNQRQQRDYRRRVDHYLHEQLTPAERETVEAAVCYPDWSYRQLGDHLHRTENTVDSQLQAAYRKLEGVFELDGVKRPTLVKVLGPYWGDGLDGFQERS